MAFIFKTSTQVESKVCPGVTVTVRRMTEDRRESLRNLMAIPLAKLQLMDEEIREKSKLTDSESRARVNELLADCGKLQTTELNDIKITWGVKSIKGLCIDDESNEATVEEWKKWPLELVVEIVNIVDRASGLLPDEVGESKPDIMPGAQGSSAPSDTTAPSANDTDGSKLEIAAPSSPSLS